jgi:hypothetical protein
MNWLPALSALYWAEDSALSSDIFQATGTITIGLNSVSRIQCKTSASWRLIFESNFNILGYEPSGVKMEISWTFQTGKGAEGERSHWK